MTEFVFIESPEGKFRCGVGPFGAGEHPPEGGEAFYLNDFALGDPAPWKIPARYFESTDFGDILEAWEGGDAFPEIEWKPLDRALFGEVFASIKSGIDAGRLRKSLPVITQRGRVINEGVPALLGGMRGLSPPFLRYGWRGKSCGFLGATPERLCSLRGRELRTMALAGTAPAEDLDIFLEDGKEIQEHTMVADYLAEKLRELGEVRCGEREVITLGPILHFLTRITVDLPGAGDLNRLIQFLHPTPALGPLPRTEASMRELVSLRAKAGAPAAFGAPLGVLAGDAFHTLVAIRGIHWVDDEVLLPSGVGVTARSVPENEWKELRLKRDSVRQFLGL